VNGRGNPSQGVDWRLDSEPWDWSSTTSITKQEDGSAIVTVMEGEPAKKLVVKAVSWEDTRVMGTLTLEVVD
jgi:hypothetical protein